MSTHTNIEIVSNMHFPLSLSAYVLLSPGGTWKDITRANKKCSTQLKVFEFLLSGSSAQFHELLVMHELDPHKYLGS